MPALTSPARRLGRGRTLLAGLLLAVGFIALSVAPAEAARHEVKIEQYAYGPSSLNISQGDTVTWTNLDTAEHDVVVTSGPVSFRSPMLSKGQSWSYTFTTAGNYAYICSVHPDMRASVAVAAVAAPPTTAPPTTAAPTPTPTVAPTPSASHHSSAPATTGKGKNKRATLTPSPTSTAQPAVATSVPTTQAATTTTTLNPLLLVAGTAVAVVVFCLLLMASRPVYQLPVEAPATDEESQDPTT